jgi:hypothetical protein
MELYVNPQITGFRQDVDGTIKELKIGSNKEDAYANIIEQGSKAKLENNKTATINVSTYTEPVEITPTSGKDGMKKATITLSNIPSGQVNAYCWGDNDIKIFTDFSSAPNSAPSYVLTAKDGLVQKTTWEDFGFDDYVYEKVDDSTIKLTSIDDPTDVITFIRWNSNDFVLW